MKLVLIAIAMLLCLGLPAGSQEKAKPFVGVEPPDWIWTGLNQMFDISSVDSVEKAAAMGVEIGYGGGDRNVVETAHRHGMKLIGGADPIPAEVLLQHPDWRARFADPPWEAQKWGCMLSSPYRQVFIDSFVNAEKKNGYDGFSWDSVGVWPFCRCAYCQAQYRKDTGREIPNPLAGLSPDPKLNTPGEVMKRLQQDKDYAVYLRWCDQRLELLLRQLRAAVRTVNPECSLLMWSTNAGRWGHYYSNPHSMPHAAHLLLDCPAQEWWLEETNAGNSLAPAFGARLIRSVSRERPTICNQYDFTHWEDLYQAGYGSSMPLFERLYRYALAITNGSIPATVLGSPYRPGDTPKQTAFFRAREPWLIREKSLKWAALVISDNTRSFYGQQSPIGRYFEHCLGTFRAATEAHLPLDMITDLDLEENRLAPYKVLILANTACLSDRAVQNLRAFVAHGGGLVATVQTSMYNDLGEPRTDFGLADLFGAHFLGMAPETGASPGGLAMVAPVVSAEAKPWESAGGAKGLLTFAATAPAEIVDSNLKETAWSGGGFVGKCARVEPGAQTLKGADLILRGQSGEPSPGTVPALLLSHAGAGRVAYFPAGIDQGYWSYPYPYERMLLVNAIRWAAGTPPPIRIEAPMLVQATFFEQQDKTGQRTIVHLLNGTNSTGGHANPLGSDVPVREEAVPVSNIKVIFTGVRPRRIHLEPEGQDLPVTQVGDGWQVTVPVLEIHSMVIAER